jgi:NAD(P)-dependent dehydrogenase (short-subunit alcohol dehydrogenase family)
VDVSDEAAVAEGVRETVALLGGLDVVVVNAGRGVPLKNLVDTTAEDYRTVMAINLDGASWTLRETPPGCSSSRAPAARSSRWRASRP